MRFSEWLALPAQQERRDDVGDFAREVGDSWDDPREQAGGWPEFDRVTDLALEKFGTTKVVCRAFKEWRLFS